MGTSMTFHSWYAAGVCILLLAPLTGSAALYFAFWREERRDSLAGGQAPCPLRRLLWGVLQSWAALFAVYALYPLRGLTLRRNAVWRREAGRNGAMAAEKEKPPLILAHPAFHNAGAWLPWLPVLYRHGYRRLHFFEYSCLRESFASASQRLARMADSVAAQHPAEKFMLLGISLGALLSRAALARAAESTRRGCGGLVTLSCPHQGTGAAALFPFGMPRELVFQGPAARWAASGESLPGAFCTAFFSPLDEMVSPSRSLHPPAGWTARRTAPLSHMATLLHGPTIRAVVEELDRLSERHGPVAEQ